ncbi:MAG: branched-chain amino acid ABC transporter permease [Firmicutes bacterium]|nr:branched-chain amino acid ABC transporter permease [Bacillota bacterium]
MNALLLSVGFGLVTASVLALSGVGLSLQFGVTNFVNFAYGDYATLGAYVALLLNAHGVNIYLAMAVAGVAVAVFAVAVNRVLFQPFLDRRVPLLTMLIVTLGLSLVIQNGIQSLWGPNFQTYTVTAQTNYALGPFLFTGQQLVIMAVAAVCLVGVYMLLQHTRMGKAMRAMSDNRELAEVSGIDTARVTDVTWLVSGFLAGVSGVVLALNVSSFTPLVGALFLFLVFSVVIMGGIGKPYGAMLGALVIGLVTEVAGGFIDSAYAQAIAFVVMIVLILVRPQGLFASRGRA